MGASPAVGDAIVRSNLDLTGAVCHGVPCRGSVDNLEKSQRKIVSPKSRWISAKNSGKIPPGIPGQVDQSSTARKHIKSSLRNVVIPIPRKRRLLRAPDNRFRVAQPPQPGKWLNASRRARPPPTAKWRNASHRARSPPPAKRLNASHRARPPPPEFRRRPWCSDT